MSEAPNPARGIARFLSVDWAAFVVAVVLAALARLGLLEGVTW
jgi:hypothetical protein